MRSERLALLREIPYSVMFPLTHWGPLIQPPVQSFSKLSPRGCRRGRHHPRANLLFLLLQARGIQRQEKSDTRRPLEQFDRVSGVL